MARSLKLTKTVGGTVKVGDMGLTTQTGNQIQVSAFIPVANGGSSAVNGSMIKQVSARRFRVTTAQGTGTCAMVVGAPAAGQLRLTVTDSVGGTYFVNKITHNKVTVTRGTGTQFATGQAVKWTFAAAVLNTTVQIASA